MRKVARRIGVSITIRNIRGTSGSPLPVLGGAAAPGTLKSAEDREIGICTRAHAEARKRGSDHEVWGGYVRESEVKSTTRSSLFVLELAGISPNRRSNTHNSHRLLV